MGCASALRFQVMRLRQQVTKFVSYCESLTVLMVPFVDENHWDREVIARVGVEFHAAVFLHVLVQKNWSANRICDLEHRHGRCAHPEVLDQIGGARACFAQLKPERLRVLRCDSHGVLLSWCSGAIVGYAARSEIWCKGMQG